MVLPTATADDRAQTTCAPGGTSHETTPSTPTDSSLDGQSGDIVLYPSRLATVPDEGSRREDRVQPGSGEATAIDGLTRLRNNRHLRQTLDEAARLAARQGTPLSVVMLGIDHLKTYNEAFGHRAGDDILRSVADLLRANVPAVDLVARYGGAEFAVVLPSSDATAALLTAERLRRSIEANAWPLRPVTASFGVVTQFPVGLEAANLLDRAVRALYRAKQRGRNRVSHADDAAGVSS